jgi:hypothetical protein
MSFTEEDIQFLSEDIRKSYEKYEFTIKYKSRKYHIFSYNYEKMILNVDIIMLDDESYRMVAKVWDYETVSNFINIGGPNVLFAKDFSSIEEAVKMLFSLKKDYKYSRLKDGLLRKDEIENLEQKILLFNKLCDDDEIDKCCVCYEPNILLTKNCRHCLCRLCFSKIEFIHDEEDEEEWYKLCPICRSRI